MKKRIDKFDISVASEIMAILCLSKDIKDLKNRLSNILIGYNEDEKPVYAKDLKAEGAMTVLLKDAIKPNLVQTLYHTPAIIHGGPFANIAHGCNSIIATKLALNLSDYVVTEAGFGADLGAEKFLDIKCRNMNICPDLVVLVTTIKALKYHGGEKEKVYEKNISALKKGLKNLYKHIHNIKDEFGLNIIIAINKYKNDNEEEIKFLCDILKEKNIEYSIVESHEKGEKGAVDIANKIVDLTKEKKQLNYIYDLNDNIEDKILKVSKKIYGAKGVVYEKGVKEKIDRIKELGYNQLPICIAKTQYSLSDNPKNLECDNDYYITVKDVEIKSGAGFIVVLAGNIMTMPGLPKIPAAENIDVNENENIVGIF